jgi:nicotinamidase-related amidase
MHTLDRGQSLLLVIDVQQRLMPAIDDGAAVIATVRRLLEAAALLEVPQLATEQNPAGLGATVASLPRGVPTLAKMSFDACRAPGFLEQLPPQRRQLLLAGCEAHVCVLQTALGLLQRGFQVYVAADAVGSRSAASKAAALARLQRHGAEIVTAEMAVFEWLESAGHPRFREAVALIK